MVKGRRVPREDGDSGKTEHVCMRRESRNTRRRRNCGWRRAWRGLGSRMQSSGGRLGHGKGDHDTPASIC